MFHELANLGLEQHVAARLQSAVMERRWRPKAETAPNCPRCDSTNTKFCYYNNYSLTQPRYFCKSCRRYWTKGGSLRNVPVGGGCRKNRRGKAVRLAGHIDPNSTSLSSANSSPLMKRGQAEEGMPPDIDLALVYEKYISQPPDDHRQPNHFSQSQAAFSELNSDGSLPEFAGQLVAGFEAGIMQTDPGFVNLMPSNGDDQLQRFCNEDAAAMAFVRADFRTEEFHGFGGFRWELGAQDVVNSQLQNSNWHDQAIGETLPEEQFGCCPDFPPNLWQSEDFLSCESPYRV